MFIHHIASSEGILVYPPATSSLASGQKPTEETEPSCRAQRGSGPSPSFPAPFPAPLSLSDLPPAVLRKSCPLEYVPLTTLLWDYQEQVSKEFICHYLLNKWRVIRICILLPQEPVDAVAGVPAVSHKSAQVTHSSP